MSRIRFEIMHGVNLNALGRRDPKIYGGLSFDQLEQQISEYARELEVETRFFQSNQEGEFVEHLLRIEDTADAIIINPGAWTHYAWAIHDALEIADLPTVEVHLSDVKKREAFRKVSVVSDLCIATISGKGPAGYRDALVKLKKALPDAR
jgi:3-dehydroquinate dehydratase-2